MEPPLKEQHTRNHMNDKILTSHKQRSAEETHVLLVKTTVHSKAWTGASLALARTPVLQGWPGAGK